jgi:hypothetical protein
MKVMGPTQCVGSVFKSAIIAQQGQIFEKTSNCQILMVAS